MPSNITDKLYLSPQNYHLPLINYPFCKEKTGLSLGGQFSSILLTVHLKSGLIRGVAFGESGFKRGVHCAAESRFWLFLCPTVRHWEH